MTDIAKLVDGYIQMWNETDPERRRALVAQTLTDDAGYLDPQLSGEGHERIDAMIAAVQERFPGFRFRLVQGPDAHHDRVRFAWQLHPAGDGPPVATGIDFGTLAADGRLRAVTGFLEQAAA